MRAHKIGSIAVVWPAALCAQHATGAALKANKIATGAAHSCALLYKGVVKGWLPRQGDNAAERTTQRSQRTSTLSMSLS